MFFLLWKLVQFWGYAAGYEYDVPVRLITDGRESDGLVEVYLNDTWGPVCDIFWTIHDANVVCWQLGYAGMHVHSISTY